MKKSIAIIGGGPAALFLALFLDARHFDIHIFEKNKTVGRKFLVAGKGGFNLSHSESMDAFIERYTPSSFLKQALIHFTNEDLRAYLEKIGIPTYVGSSKRVFPIRGIKPITVLKAILAVLEKKVSFHYEHTWTAWTSDKHLIFNQDNIHQADYTIFSLGGGSWKVTGSDGSWLDTFKAKGIKTKAFVAANCAFGIDWPMDFIPKNAGKPLKNIAVTCKEKTQKGELVITPFGLEGNAIYALSPQIQEALSQDQKAKICLDFKPTLTLETVQEKIQQASQLKPSKLLRDVLKLSPAQVNLLKAFTDKSTFLDPSQLGKSVKSLPLDIHKAANIDEAISTSGGILRSELSEHFELKQLPRQFCIGEMIDWNAPTGGYLLHACFSMGVYLARHLNSK